VKTSEKLPSLAISLFQIKLSYFVMKTVLTK